MKYLLSLFLIFQCIISKSQKKVLDSSFKWMSLSPMAIANNTGFGLGMQYEWGFNKRKNLTFIAPFSVTEVLISKSMSSTKTGYYGNDVKARMFFLSPSLRYYTGRKNMNGIYAIGGSLICGNGMGQGNSYSNATNNLQYRSVLGFAISNTVNIQILKQFKTQVDLQLGVVSDNGVNSAAGSGPNPFGQLSFSIGYCW